MQYHMLTMILWDISYILQKNVIAIMYARYQFALIHHEWKNQAAFVFLLPSFLQSA
jgi:hypothetical protein